MTCSDLLANVQKADFYNKLSRISKFWNLTFDSKNLVAICNRAMLDHTDQSSIDEMALVMAILNTVAAQNKVSSVPVCAHV